MFSWQPDSEGRYAFVRQMLRETTGEMGRGRGRERKRERDRDRERERERERES